MASTCIGEESLDIGKVDLICLMLRRVPSAWCREWEEQKETPRPIVVILCTDCKE